MKNHLKWIIPLAFIISANSIIPAYYFQNGVICILGVIGTWAFGVINVVMAIYYGKKKDKDALLLGGTMIKSMMITLYIIIFVLALAFVAMFTFLTGPFSLLTTIPAIIVDIFILIVSSSYMLSYLIVEFIETRKVSNIIQCILQFIYVIDVFDMLYICFFKAKKYRILALLSTIIATAIPFLLLWLT